MMTNISITREGNYLVFVFRRDENGYGRWHELRCFSNEGDAKEFAVDVHLFTDKEIELAIRTYNPWKVFVRLGFREYKILK